MKAIQKTILEGLIPIIGYFYWNWSLAFILFFYFIDWLAKEIGQHIASRNIQQTQGKSISIWKKHGLLSLVILMVSISIWVAVLYLRSPQFNVSVEVVRFLSYKEMGIPQGLILAPIVALSVYLNYKMEFVGQKMNQRVTMKNWWKPHQQLNLGYICCAVACFGLFTLKPLFSLILLVSTPLLVTLIQSKFTAK